MDYYVDSINGSDANAGTSQAKPWRTLAPVHARNFLPGDVVSFRRGSSWIGESIHWKGALAIDDSGVEGNPITFTAYGVGDRPVITNPGSPDNWTRAVVIKADWVILEEFLVREAWRDGVYIDGGKHNVVRDVEATDVGAGICCAGRYNLLTQNYIHDLHMVKNTLDIMDDDFGANGIKFYKGYNEASYNTLVNCIAPSYDYGTDGGAFELFGYADGNYIHHNRATGCDGFLEVGGGSARDTIVAYNVAVNCRRFSLLILAGPYASQIENFRVENNTIVQTQACNYIFHFGRAAPEQNTLLVRNNIVHAHNVWHVAKYDTFTHDHNLYYLSGSSALNMNLHQGEKIADPLFVDLAAEDFHLQSASPARAAGVWLGYTFDFDGKLVIDPPDLGAYQYQEETEMNIVEMLRLKATELRAMADEIDAAADTLAAIDVAAQAAVVETEQALAATQAVEEAL